MEIMSGTKRAGTPDRDARRFRLSLFSFLSALALLVVAVLAFLYSLATGKSSWTIAFGDAIYLAAAALTCAALAGLLSLAAGVTVVRRRPVALLWLVPEAALYAWIVWYFISIQ
ncbi:MAG: hypothetical protein PHN82_02830 [bacterium]|nr:hypothetical protein [bacterium]